MKSFYGTRLSENMAKTPEGYLICYDVNIARIGTQEYLGSELGVNDEIVIVNRLPDEVFKPATVASFEGKPFTNDHPFELLDVSNTSIYEKGHVQNVRISDDRMYLVADIIVTDLQTITDIENGKRELSAGYNCDCEQDEDGNWYQCNIIGNHVALVDKGRAGNKVRINDKDPERWITTKTGAHIPVFEGESEEEAIENFKENTTGGGYSEFGESNRAQIARAEGKGTKKELAKTLGITQKEADTLYSSEWHHTGKSYKKESFYPIEAYKDLQEKGEISQESIDKYELSEIDKIGIKTSFEKLLQKQKGKTGEELLNPYIEKYKNDEPLQGILSEALNKRKKNVSLPAQEIRNMIETVQEYGSDRLESTLEERLEKLENTIKFWSSAEREKRKNKHRQDNAIIVNKEKEQKPMKTKNNVLGKLLKAFAQDAEPEEMLEAVKAVQGEDEEPKTDDRLEKLEARVAEIAEKLNKLYLAEKKEEEGEMHALDELENELIDEEPDKKGEEIEDEDANNDPKLIEAISKKAQADEDEVETIKKEIADAKKVIAKIEDKETRLAVADSLAKVIRGKMKSSENYKKLMDASKKKAVSDSKAVDYSAVFKAIKENNFRK